MIRTNLTTKHGDTITFDYRYTNYIDKPIIRITSSFSKRSVVVIYEDILEFIDGIIEGYCHYTDSTGDDIELINLSNITYIGICSTLANFFNSEYDNLFKWCLQVIERMREGLDNEL